MRKLWTLTIILFLTILAGLVYSQESEILTEPTVSCLGLENPKNETQMIEFRDCINRFNKERKLIKKNKAILQKIFDSKQLIKRKINIDAGKSNIDHRIPMNVSKPMKIIARRKFEASEQITMLIKKTMGR